MMMMMMMMMMLWTPPHATGQSSKPYDKFAPKQDL
jgi:hypothetical protein